VSDHRVRRWALPFATGLAVIGVGFFVLGLLAFPGGEGWGYDYRAYLDAAERLAETGSLYQAETIDGPYRPGPYGLYMYAPPLGVAMTPMTSLSVASGTIVWFLLHAAALGLACAVMPVRDPIRLAAFGLGALSYAVTRDLVLGNVSLLLLLAMSVAWRWLDRPAGSVALALAMSLRPTTGVFLIWQLLRRQWRAAAWVVGSGIVLIFVTLPFVGVDGYRDYVAVLGNMSEVTGVERNIDLGSMALELSASEEVATLLLLSGYAVAIVAVLVSLRRDREVGFMVTLGASLLLSPLLWDHYLTALLLPAAFLAQRGLPVALLLPMLSWLPAVFLPWVVVLATILPFWARAASPSRLGRS